MRGSYFKECFQIINTSIILLDTKSHDLWMKVGRVEDFYEVTFEFSFPY